MKSHIYVDNIKCAGCATTVTNKVLSIPSIKDVEVDVSTGKVSFDCQSDACRMEVVTMLKKWGYPLAGKGDRVDHAKSYVSCMLGKIDNLKTGN